MSYKKKMDNDVVTIFGRKELRPELDQSQRIESQDIPEFVYFTLSTGEVFRVAARADIIIGRKPRSEDPDVTIDLEAHDGHAQGVSRHHAMVKYSNGSLMLVDLDSINGTFINKQRALPTKRYALMDGDQLSIGRLKMKYTLKKP